MVILSVVFARGTVFLISFYFIQKGFVDRGKQELTAVTKAVQAVVDETHGNVQGIGAQFASRPGVIAAIMSGAAVQVQKAKTFVAGPATMVEDGRPGTL